MHIDSRETGERNQAGMKANQSKRHTALTVMNRAKPGRATSEENAIIYARKRMRTGIIPEWSRRWRWRIAPFDIGVDINGERADKIWYPMKVLKMIAEH
jgi:hypothetical protein